VLSLSSWSRPGLAAIHVTQRWNARPVCTVIVLYIAGGLALLAGRLCAYYDINHTLIDSHLFHVVVTEACNFFLMSG